jgi:hypothetical protein
MSKSNGHAKYHRKIIHISAEDSPNVRYARAQIKAGQKPTGDILVPGVLPWADFVHRDTTWDDVRKCIGLKGQFWVGASTLLYPPTWLNHAESLYQIRSNLERQAEAIGVDPAEGGDKTAMCAIDRYGVIEIVSRRTPNTKVIVGEIKMFMRKHGIQKHEAHRVMIDLGGGKVHKDYLEADGYEIRGVAFGGTPANDPHPGKTGWDEKEEGRERRYLYKNRRAQMYGQLRTLLDPSHPTGFALPPSNKYPELRRQLAPIPLLWDEHGKLRLPPKSKKTKGGEKTLVELIGHSPDEADALVIAVHCMLHPIFSITVGAR